MGQSAIHAAEEFFRISPFDLGGEESRDPAHALSSLRHLATVRPAFDRDHELRISIGDPA